MKQLFAPSNRGWAFLAATFISISAGGLFLQKAQAQDCAMKAIEKTGADQTAMMVANLNCAVEKMDALETELAHSGKRRAWSQRLIGLS